MKNIGTMITGMIKKYRKYKRWQSLLIEWDTAYRLDLKCLGLYTLRCGFEDHHAFGDLLLKDTRRAYRNMDRLRKLRGV